MDTKSRKSRPFLSWLCFFIGLSIVCSFSLFSLIMSQNYYFNFGDIKDVYNSDFKETGQFKHTLTLRFNNLAEIIANYKESETEAYEGVSNSEMNLGILDQEGRNLIYYAKNVNTGKIVTNNDNTLDITETGLTTMPDGYDYYLYFNGDKFFAEKDGHPLDVYRNDSGYSNLKHWGFMDKNFSRGIPGINECRILIIVKKDIVENPYGHSFLYQSQQEAYAVKWILPVLAGVFLFGVLLLVISIIMRKQKHEFDIKLAGFTGQFWLELKIGMTIIINGLSFSITGGSSLNSFFEYLLQIIPIGICGWWLYLMLVDLIVNKKKVFTNNIVNSTIKRYRVYECKKPFQKALIFRAYSLIASEIFLVLLAIIIFGGLAANGGVFGIILFFLIVITGIYLMYRYFRRYGNTVKDIGHVLEQIEEIKYGDMNEKHVVMPEADLFQAQENLNQIQEGISRVVEEKVRSERMKVDLITNVSHDLKTPLTSIISYIDLLSKEEELPQHVKDYVSILSQKSERLKTLIQDLFDLSKVNSGNVVIEREKLDLCKVVKQTLGEMDEEISRSGLMFKAKIPEDAIFIMSDGSKLYRVFLNLVSNALKYSLTGSRVFVEVTVEDRKAEAVIKNIANYEMVFNEDEIVERFVRGDEARTTEGTGLGLAIAKSFTQACGGQLKVKVDGDLFKVAVTFEVCD